jgi:hypothetical protein
VNTAPIHQPKIAATVVPAWLVLSAVLQVRARLGLWFEAVDVVVAAAVAGVLAEELTPLLQDVQRQFVVGGYPGLSLMRL